MTETFQCQLFLFCSCLLFICCPKRQSFLSRKMQVYLHTVNLDGHGIHFQFDTFMYKFDICTFLQNVPMDFIHILYLDNTSDSCVFADHITSKHFCCMSAVYIESIH